ncbi:hypothetical protein V1264_008796 [Littorina saxatilis]|uniref:Uncharacterized protein n=2 Tax=Littorina saxatilis TaxID=31220 RepID=A0AAN9G2P0_9CAEN
MGYTADCEVCKDIDECETGDNTCIHLGQKCVNTEGSFQCQCQDGFVKKDDFCHDINECEDAETNCGEHAECKNLLGTYRCICCQGYSKNAEQCQRDERLDSVYGAPGEECCACSGGQCRNPEPVCGSDGKTYGNFAAMVVQGCRNNRTIEVDHKGYCEDSCSDVKCDKPFQKCSQTGPGGSAKCSCPDCGGASTPDNSNPVCGSNKKVYSSACMFRLVMCEIDRSDIKLEDSMEPCEEGKDEPVTKWSDWSECDVKCGKGRTRRNRQRLRQTDLPLTQEASCYKLCNDGPCRPGTCNNPGQVCVVDGATGKGRCECPDCAGRPESPVCGLVGNVVRSFHNECKLKRTACELAKNFQLLENRACEEKPQNCSVTRNFAKLRDADGCVSAGDQDVGFCYGGCGDVPGKCCRPDTTATPQRSASLTFTCPDGSTRTKQEQVITACSCVAEPEQ